MLDELDPPLPAIFLAHASVQGATYGTERMVMLGQDLVLNGSLVRDPRLDYVALGHIHKWQDLNDGQGHPIIYPGSIERVDFGEVADEKRFAIAHIEKGNADIEWIPLTGRPFVDQHIHLTESSQMQTPFLIAKLPSQDQIKDAIVRLVLEYPREWEALLDEPAIRQYFDKALEFHLIRRPTEEARGRIPVDEGITSKNHLELLDLYWKTLQQPSDDLQEVNQLAAEIMQSVAGVNSAEE
jgi:exonuclease SbcD